MRFVLLNTELTIWTSDSPIRYFSLISSLKSSLLAYSLSNLLIFFFVRFNLNYSFVRHHLLISTTKPPGRLSYITAQNLTMMFVLLIKDWFVNFSFWVFHIIPPAPLHHVHAEWTKNYGLTFAAKSRIFDYLLDYKLTHDLFFISSHYERTTRVLLHPHFKF